MPCQLYEVTHSLLNLAVMARRHTSVAIHLDHEVGELKRLAFEGNADYADCVRSREARSQWHHHRIARVVAIRNGSEMEAVAVDDDRFSVEVSTRRAEMFMVQGEGERQVRRCELPVDYLVRGRPQS